MDSAAYTSYQVWDRTIRWFHWINFLAVLGLIGTGLVIYNGKALGLSADAKVFMKEFHSWFGYVMAANLLWRIIWGFVGGRFSRWPDTLPFGRAYLAELRHYLKSLRSGEPLFYLGHNPLGRLMVLLMLLLLAILAVTGLVLAGTDLYFPPFGSWIASWVAPAGVDPATLLPGDKTMANAAAWDAMRAFRKPFISLHEWAFYLLSAAIVAHIAAVVMGEIKEKTGLVSAMFHGNKVLPKKPVDLD
jgi:cytochrome b